REKESGPHLAVILTVPTMVQGKTPHTPRHVYSVRSPVVVPDQKETACSIQPGSGARVASCRAAPVISAHHFRMSSWAGPAKNPCTRLPISVSYFYWIALTWRDGLEPATSDFGSCSVQGGSSERRWSSV